jgi:hypothetical protein
MSQDRIFDKLATLDKKRETLYGTNVSQMLNSFRTTHYTVNKNYQELSSAINSYEANTKLWDNEKREERILFFMELSRLLHNYLASTYTLISQGEKISEKYEKIRFFYNNKIDSLRSDDSYNFSRCLRHITQHHELLALVARFSRIGIEIGKPAKQSIILEKKSLLDKKDELYHTPEREGFIRYINNHDEIDLKFVLTQYQLLLDNFFEQIHLKTRELYAKELEEYYMISKEIDRLQLELFSKNKPAP